MTGEGRARRLLGLRGGEGRTVGLAVVAAFFASAGLMIGQSGIEALFFARYGVSKLPVMYLVLGGTMFALTVAFGALLGRLGRGRACLMIPVVLAVAAALGRVALAADAGWVTPALWLLQGAAQFLVGLAVWGLAGLVTDTRQAKRFFPLIGAGSVLGYVVGGLVTKPLATSIGSPNLLIVWTATLIVVVVVGVRLLAIGGEAGRPPSAPQRVEGAIDQLLGGFRSVRRSTLMRWMALGSVLFSLLFFSLYLPFSRAATVRYPDPDDLAGFFGVFFGVSTGVAFLLSLFVTNRLLRRFGVPTVMLVLPLLYLVAFAVLAVDASFASLAIFRFVQVAWMSGGAISASEAVINAVPPGRRDQVRAFLYGGPTQVGTVLAGVIALVGDALSPSMLYGIGVASAALATVAMIGVRRAYPRELAHALREGRPLVFGSDPAGNDPFGLQRADRSAVTAVMQAAGDPDPGLRRVAAHVLGDLDARDAVAPLQRCLLDDDDAVRATAIASLARSAGPDAVPAILERADDGDAGVRLAVLESIDALGADDDTAARAARSMIDDADLTVRARAATSLMQLGMTEEGVAMLAKLAADADEGVRAAAFQAMRGPGAGGLFDVARAGLADAAPSVRAEAAAAIGRLDPQRALDPLVAALGDEHRVVRDGAASTLGGLSSAAAGDAIVDALSSPSRRAGAVEALRHVPLEGRTDDVRRFATEAAEAAANSARSASAFDATSDERLGLLRDSLLARSDRLAMLALRAAAALERRDEMWVALDSLRVTDPAERANALEVIESVGTRDVVAPLVAMWDDPRSPVDREAALEHLRTDPDPWIRACVELTSPTADGPATEPEGGTMTRTLTTMSPMERVLSLRKVSLFVGLPPADLQPIAAIAEEHAYADGDVIAAQGDRGDAMHIIVTGDVSVRVRGDIGNGGDERADRVVAVRSAGDVVGEMAVITNEPRVATLVATGAVRVLTIARPQFESILRERPETALAVIRVLCQRLAERPSTDAGTGTTTASV